MLAEAQHKYSEVRNAWAEEDQAAWENEDREDGAAEMEDEEAGEEEAEEGEEEEESEDVEDDEDFHFTPTDDPRRRPARYFDVGTTKQVKNGHALSKVASVCFLCGSSSHIASRCPNDVCVGCLQRGHTLKFCPLARTLRPMVCSACGKPGHQSR